MELDYEKKDIKKAPKVKEGVYKNDKMYSFLDRKGFELSFDTKENAEIAYKRLYG